VSVFLTIIERAAHTQRDSPGAERTGAKSSIQLSVPNETFPFSAANVLAVVCYNILQHRFAALPFYTHQQ